MTTPPSIPDPEASDDVVVDLTGEGAGAPGDPMVVLAERAETDDTAARAFLAAVALPAAEPSLWSSKRRPTMMLISLLVVLMIGVAGALVLVTTVTSSAARFPGTTPPQVVTSSGTFTLDAAPVSPLPAEVTAVALPTDTRPVVQGRYTGPAGAMEVAWLSGMTPVHEMNDSHEFVSGFLTTPTTVTTTDGATITCGAGVSLTTDGSLCWWSKPNVGGFTLIGSGATAAATEEWVRLLLDAQSRSTSNGTNIGVVWAS